MDSLAEGGNFLGEINTIWAFFAGGISFLSPCVLPVLPAFLASITGMATKKQKWGYGFSFLAGFSLIFLALAFTTSGFGLFFQKYQEWVRIFGGVLTIFFGMVVAEIFQPRFLMTERRRFLNLKSQGGAFGVFLIGFGFAAGWSPCIGPILASVLAMGAFNPTMAVVNMAAYIFGFAVPFLICLFFIEKFQFLKKHTVTIQKVGGYVMILMGFLLLLDWFAEISAFLFKWIGNFAGV